METMVADTQPVKADGKILTGQFYVKQLADRPLGLIRLAQEKGHTDQL